MRREILGIGLLISLVLFSGALTSVAQTQPSLRSYKSGKVIFETRCSPCHGVHQEIVGPMLAGISKKHKVEWLIEFIRDSQGVIVSQDPYATFLFERYNHQVMPAFKKFSVNDIQDILNFIESESVKPVYDYASETDRLVRQQAGTDVLRGKQIFQEQCSSCHFVYHEGYGPPLGSVTKRHSRAWLFSFIRNSQKLIKGGDSYAVQLFEKYEQREMVPMEFLREDEIESILAYISFASSSPSAASGVNGRKMLAAWRSTNIPPSVGAEKAGERFFRILLIVFALVAAALFAFLIVKLYQYLKKEKTTSEGSGNPVLP